METDKQTLQALEPFERTAFRDSNRSKTLTSQRRASVDDACSSPTTSARQTEQVLGPPYRRDSRSSSSSSSMASSSSSSSSSLKRPWIQLAPLKENDAPPAASRQRRHHHNHTRPPHPNPTEDDEDSVVRKDSASVVRSKENTANEPPPAPLTAFSRPTPDPPRRPFATTVTTKATTATTTTIRSQIPKAWGVGGEGPPQQQQQQQLATPETTTTGGARTRTLGTPLHSSSSSSSSLLRYGERLEDLFGIVSSVALEDAYYTACRRLVTLEEAQQRQQQSSSSLLVSPALASFSSPDGSQVTTHALFAERCRLWWQILQQASERLTGAQQLRLVRRATARLPWNGPSPQQPPPDEWLQIWLHLVKVQCQYASVADARLTLRHLAASRRATILEPHAAYHLVRAQVAQATAGQTEADVIRLLQQGLAGGAQPATLLQQALLTRGVGVSTELQHPPAPQPLPDPNADQEATSLDDSNMSLDDEGEEEMGVPESNPAAPPVSAIQPPLVIPVELKAGPLPSFVATDIPPHVTKPSTVTRTAAFPPITDGTATHPDLDHTKQQQHGTPSVSSSSKHQPGRSTLKRRPAAFGSVIRRPLMGQTPRLTKLGKAQRVDPNHSVYLDESQEEEEEDTTSLASASTRTTMTTTTTSHIVAAAPAVTKKPSLAKLELSYIFEWDPNKRFRESSTNDPVAVPKGLAPPLSSMESSQGGGGCGDSNHSNTLTLDKSSSGSAGAVDSKELTQPVPSKVKEGSDKGSKKDTRPALTSLEIEPRLTERSFASSAIISVPSTDSASAAGAPSTTSLLPSVKVNTDFLPLVSENNILRVNKVAYAKLGVVGKGGSCKVYRALSKDCSVVAIKKVKTTGMDRKAMESYANEISLLKSLRGNPAIIQMYDSQVDLDRKTILVVMELGEVDLNHVLQQQNLMVDRTEGHRRLNMNFVRLTWHQMLSAVHCIHEARIIHSDLKPANFLFVRGALKLIDFGIAKAIQSDDTNNIYRDSQIGTLNYMSPEAILDSGGSSDKPKMKLGRASDIWSLGCILYQMVYGKTPFADLQMIQKLQAIINPKHRISFPDDVEQAAREAMQACLRRSPEDRPPIVGTCGLLNEDVFLNPPRQQQQGS